jgi:hypothetical protein
MIGSWHAGRGFVFKTEKSIYTDHLPACQLPIMLNKTYGQKFGVF